MEPQFDPKWVAYFFENGFPQARGLSTGMEGAVYSLVDQEWVAKVWANKSEEGVRKLKRFYEALRRSAGAIATPEIKEVRVINGVSISIERYLRGSPLLSRIDEGAAHPNEKAVEAVIHVLRFLQNVPPSPDLAQLSLLDEQLSACDLGDNWGGMMFRLIERRMSRFAGPLLPHVPNLFGVMSAVEDFLRSRNSVPKGLVHGDLWAANIMVDESSRPLAVFDFGFLSAVGDPAFDASVSSAIFNMYGPHARQIEEEVTAAVASALGHPPEILLAYRAAYCLITSNAYSLSGKDGHFKWCVAMLNRHDVRAALQL